MKSSSSGVKHALRLFLAALLCAVPFLGTAVYLMRHVERVDTLPYDEYADLRWLNDGSGVVFLHRPLERSGQAGRTEVWVQDSRTEKFQELAVLPEGRAWGLSERCTRKSFVLQDEENKLALLERTGDGEPQYLAVPQGWELAQAQGVGLFMTTLEKNIPFDQFVDVESAPEVKNEDSGDSSAVEESSPAAPTRQGLKIARFQEESSNLEPLLSIPFTNPEEQPELLLMRESPDERLLALVLRFGKGNPGLWVYDAEAERLLWTRVVVSESVSGLAWSDDSVGLAVADDQGVVLMESALGIESTRYKAEGLEDLHPRWTQGGGIVLVNRTNVLALDRSTGQATIVFRSAERNAQEMAVDPSASSVSYIASPRGVHELFLTELNGAEEFVSRATLPGSLREAAQGTLLYQLGRTLRDAARFWTERHQ